MRNPETLHPATLPNRKSAYQTLEEERQARPVPLEHRGELPDREDPWVQLRARLLL